LTVKFLQKLLEVLGAVGLVCMVLAIGPAPGSAADAPAVQVVPEVPGAIAERQKTLAAKAPKGAKLVAYLDCGCERESTPAEKVKIACVSGKPFRFPVEAPGALPTQATVFYDTDRVAFEISGLDRTRRYLAGMSWWDYDNGNRTQSVVVGSPDERLVRLAVPAIRLPDYKESKQRAAERRFQLPVVFSQDGKLRFVVERVDGANAVISELWVYRLD
jgi:hypothetical protein